jgi:hypothetical protein
MDFTQPPRSLLRLPETDAPPDDPEDDDPEDDDPDEPEELDPEELDPELEDEAAPEPEAPRTVLGDVAVTTCAAGCAASPPEPECTRV